LKISQPHKAEVQVAERELFFSLIRKRVPAEAFRYNRMFRARLTLELYKYPIAEVIANPQLILREADLLLEELDAAVDHNTGTRPLLLPGKQDHILLHETMVKPVDEELALFMHARYHYLLTPRTAIFHLGLFSPAGHMLGLASFSENDLTHLNPILPDGITQKDSLVLSRFVTFDYTPLNTPTHFLGQASKWIRGHYPGVRLALSYLDPNLGFEGTIYKAYNAKLVAEEAKRRYLYDHGRYASDRSMLERFGTADWKKLHAKDAAITQSVEPLKPLQVYAWDINRKRPIRFHPERRTISPHPNLVG
jgi:hypothetical protein